MKLYVWEDVLCDCSCGLMFALAENEDQARKLIMKKDNRGIPDDDDNYCTMWNDLKSKPDVYDNNPAGFYCWGGG